MEVDEPAPAPVRPPPPPPQHAQPPPPPVPRGPSGALAVSGDLKIRKDYDPKAASRHGPSEPMQVSPLTGELVPASKMAEHMRIGLLDPRWKEQKERYNMINPEVVSSVLTFLLSCLVFSFVFCRIHQSVTCLGTRQTWRKIKMVALSARLQQWQI